MAIGDLVTNVSNGINLNITDSLVQVFSPIMGILKAISIAFLIWIIFMIIKAIVNIRVGLNIRKMAANVEDINHKLDLLIKKSKK